LATGILKNTTTTGIPTIAVPGTDYAPANLTATATLDFASIAAQTCSGMTVTVTGATENDAVALGAPASIEAGLSWSGRVSAADTVTIRLCNVTASPIDPASADWSVVVIPV
jgi:alpha-D-ribose 1-methylphosphonate 5-triphosphate diphosphatase PhnM